MIPPEQKAKLEQMARNHGGYSTREGWIEVSTPHSVEQYLAGCEAAWEMAVQYERERIAPNIEAVRRMIQEAYIKNWSEETLRALVYTCADKIVEILNPPEQKEEGDRG